MPLALLLIPFFAWADRFVGGAGKRSIAFGAVGVLALAAWLLLHKPALAILLIVWAVYRSLPWKIGGTSTPHGGQIAGALIRHAVPFLAAFILHLGGWVSSAPLIPLSLYAIAATLLAVWYAGQVDHLAATGGHEDGSINAKLEMVRGGAFGAALAFSGLA